MSRQYDDKSNDDDEIIANMDMLNSIDILQNEQDWRMLADKEKFKNYSKDSQSKKDGDTRSK